MKSGLQYGIDATVAVLLLLALGAVFRMDRAVDTPAEDTPQLTVVKADPPPEPAAPPPPPLKIAVTYCPRDRAEYDDMGRLLRKLGQGYEYTPIHMDDLTDYDKLGQYDIVFVTCGTYTKLWLERESLGKGIRPDTETRPMNRDTFEKAKEALRRFVGDGKTLYASDQMFSLINYAFPEYTTGLSSREILGDKQTVEARITDPGLNEQLGQEMSLRFDLPDWYPAAFDAPGMTTYLEGRYRSLDGSSEDGRLLVKVPHEQGTILFTSFHNEKQNSEKEFQLLKYLVFATVTARETSKVTQTMLAGGFSPKKQSLLSASSGSPTVSQTYKSRRDGRLQFVLGFEDRGARLKLSVVGPDGKAHEAEGTSTFKVEVDRAPAGDWRYTITAEKVPYENFPFNLTVGEE